MERPPFIVSGDQRRWKERLGPPQTPENRLSLQRRQYISVWYGVKVLNAEKAACSALAIVIKEIRTFSFYYFSRQPIIKLFVNRATQK
jgi:hypothetical protein